MNSIYDPVHNLSIIYSVEFAKAIDKTEFNQPYGNISTSLCFRWQELTYWIHLDQLHINRRWLNIQREQFMIECTVWAILDENQ